MSLSPEDVAALPKLHELVKNSGGKCPLKGMYHWVEASKVCGLPVIDYRSAGLVPRFESFILQQKLVIYLEVRIMTEVVGYVLRSASSKRYLTDATPGLYLAQRGLRALDSFAYGNPIVICEGAADAEILSQAYPWVCAFLTASVTRNQAAILSCFTDRVLLVPDNDKAGRKGRSRARKILDDVKVDCELIELPDDMAGKDPGDLVYPGNEDHLEYVLDMISVWTADAILP